MNRLEAPALRGNTALGFLAAVGVVALSEQECIAPVRLAWEGGIVPQAVFVSEAYATLEELAGDLRKVADELAANGQAIPGVPPHFPYKERHPRDTATKADPMRMSRAAATATYEDAAAAWARGERWFGRWLAALMAVHAVDSKKADAKRGNRSGEGVEQQQPVQGAIRLTPFNVGFGQMKFRDSFFDKTLEELRKIPKAPLDAFTGWQRVEEFTGGKLEHGALRGATVATDGKPRNVAAPSPTWLANMGMRMFPLADDGVDVRAAGWQRALMEPGAKRQSLVWPVWREALTAPAIRVLIDHPALRIEERPGRLVLPEARTLAGLGVTAVFGASRRTESQGDGPIGPARLLWPTAGRRSGRG